jgi:S1-C subfamily serine protease
VADLKEYGSVQRAYIGINIRDIDESLAKEKNIDDRNGIYVAGLADKGSAKEAGLKEGDIIKKVDGATVINIPALQEKLGQKRPGDKVNLTLLRDGELITKKVTLKNIEGNTEIIKSDNKELFRTLGVRLKDLGKDEMKELKVTSGILVEEVLTGKFRNSGIGKGFIIQKVDNAEIRSVEQFTEILKDKNGGVLLEGVYPNGQRAYYGLGL